MADKGGLREFVAVVEHGSFTKAAEALHVTTSFVSREVTRLEERLDTRLLHRSTRSLSVTQIGQMYYERGREIHVLLESLESDIADLQDQPKGKVRVTAAPFYAERYLAPALAEFTISYPEVSIEIDTSGRVSDIIAEGFDLAIRTAALEDSSLIARKIATRRYMVCASPAYFKRCGRPQTPEELVRHNCLTVPTIPWRFEQADGPRVVQASGTWSSDNLLTLAVAAVRGVGLVRIPDYFVEEEIRTGQLEAVLEDYEVSNAATWLVYPARDRLPNSVRCLIDFLAERLRRDEAMFQIDT